MEKVNDLLEKAAKAEKQGYVRFAEIYLGYALSAEAILNARIWYAKNFPVR